MLHKYYRCNAFVFSRGRQQGLPFAGNFAARGMFMFCSLRATSNTFTRTNDFVSNFIGRAAAVKLLGYSRVLPQATSRHLVSPLAVIRGHARVAQRPSPKSRAKKKRGSKTTGVLAHLFERIPTPGGERSRLMKQLSTVPDKPTTTNPSAMNHVAPSYQLQDGMKKLQDSMLSGRPFDVRHITQLVGERYAALSPFLQRSSSPEDDGVLYFLFSNGCVALRLQLLPMEACGPLAAAFGKARSFGFADEILNAVGLSSETKKDGIAANTSEHNDLSPLIQRIKFKHIERLISSAVEHSDVHHAHRYFSLAQLYKEPTTLAKTTVARLLELYGTGGMVEEARALFDRSLALRAARSHDASSDRSMDKEDERIDDGHSGADSQLLPPASKVILQGMVSAYVMAGEPDNALKLLEYLQGAAPKEHGSGGEVDLVVCAAHYASFIEASAAAGLFGDADHVHTIANERFGDKESRARLSTAILRRMCLDQSKSMEEIRQWFDTLPLAKTSQQLWRYRTLLEACTQRKDSRSAREILESMGEREKRIDLQCWSQLMSIYLERGDLNTAFALIQDMAQKANQHGEEELSSGAGIEGTSKAAADAVKQLSAMFEHVCRSMEVWKSWKTSVRQLQKSTSAALSAAQTPK